MQAEENGKEGQHEEEEEGGVRRKLACKVVAAS